MARTKGTLGAGTRLCDYLTASLLALVYPAERVHAALNAPNCNAQRIRRFPLPRTGGRVLPDGIEPVSRGCLRRGLLCGGAGPGQGWWRRSAGPDVQVLHQLAAQPHRPGAAARPYSHVLLAAGSPGTSTACPTPHRATGSSPTCWTRRPHQPWSWTKPYQQRPRMVKRRDSSYVPHHRGKPKSVCDLTPVITAPTGRRPPPPPRLKLPTFIIYWKSIGSGLAFCPALCRRYTSRRLPKRRTLTGPSVLGPSNRNPWLKSVQGTSLRRRYHLHS